MTTHQVDEAAATGALGHDVTSHISDESRAYWRPIVAAMPPMTAEEIADVGAVIRRIEDRRSYKDSAQQNIPAYSSPGIMTSQLP